MSQRALMQAVRDHLQTALSLTDVECGVEFDGQPPAVCGEQFVAVWPGEWLGQSEDADLDEVFGVNVSVTRRLGAVPPDRQGDEVWAKATTGVEAVVRQVIVAIHKSYTVMNAANALISGDVSMFVEPLVFKGGGRPERKGSAWFGGDGGRSPRKPAVDMGVVQTVMFTGARRLQSLGDMT